MVVPNADARLGMGVCVGLVGSNTTTSTQMTYTMHWRSRTSPDNRGTGLEVKDWKEATAICLEHNTLYPEFTHWAEPNTNQQPNNNDNSTGQGS